MQRRSLIAGTAALCLAAPGLALGQARTEIHFWYGLAGALGERVAEQIKRFNGMAAGPDLMPGAGQDHADEFEDGGIVIHDMDSMCRWALRWHRFLSSAKPRRG